MCQKIGSENVAPGWICCKCKIYNGEQRAECKQCKHARCAVEEIATKVASVSGEIPAEVLAPLFENLKAILVLGNQLIANVEQAQAYAGSFPELIKQLNRIELPKEIREQTNTITPRLMALVGDPLILGKFLEMMPSSEGANFPN